MDIEIIEVTESLYHKYPAQTAPQDCYVWLNCECRKLSASYNSQIGSGVPEGVYHGRVLRWGIPVLTPESANELLQGIADAASRVCDGYETIWNGHNHVGRLTETAEEASEEIAEACERSDGWGHIESRWDVDEWYCDGYKKTAHTLGITAETTDEKLAEIAADELEFAKGELIDGGEAAILEYLTEARQDLRDDAE